MQGVIDKGITTSNRQNLAFSDGTEKVSIAPALGGGTEY